ncbi:hypothetical protein PENTCL1PPCAC_23682, partial [Pristionchus entomophagus]
RCAPTSRMSDTTFRSTHRSWFAEVVDEISFPSKPISSEASSIVLQPEARLFPRERLVAEVAVASSLLEDRALESEILQKSGSEVEVLVDNAEQLELAQWRGVVRDDGDGEGLGHADGVRHLIVESDLLDGVYDETLVVDDSLARDFSGQENHSSLGYSF